MTVTQEQIDAQVRRAREQATLEATVMASGWEQAHTVLSDTADMLEQVAADLLTVCQREAATIARYDAKLDAAELAARYESDLAEQALQEMKAQKARAEALEAENARLRESLSLIAVMGYSENPEVGKRIGELAVNQAREAVRENHAVDARAALQDPSP